MPHRKEAPCIGTHRLHPPVTAEPPSAAPQRLLPLGALAAGFGLFNAPRSPRWRRRPRAARRRAGLGRRRDAGQGRHVLQPISVKAKVETDRNSVRATTSTIGNGNQELRDIPQSVTVVTEKLMEDRRVDTVKEALHYTAGISFMAAEGGEEDIRLRGFSLTASGDIFVDGIRDTGVLRARHLQLRPDRGAARLGLDAVRPRLDRRRRQPGEQGSRCSTNINEVSTHRRHRQLPAR